jgi:LacI family transcriptional regulator
MTEKNPKIRIKDIAILAGVSEGTVDRVLHRRGDVSAKSLEAVNKVLEEMNYTPNLFARSLASKRQYRFACLFPEYKLNEYWQGVSDGFDQAAKEFINFNVLIEKNNFNQFDAKSFVQKSEQIINNVPDAVFIAPIFREECLQFIAELSKQNIPFSFIDSMLEGTDFVSYYGQHSFQSGYIAAKLLLENFQYPSQLLLVRTQRKGATSNQTLNRSAGFMQYIADYNLQKNIEIVNVELLDDNESENLAILSAVFEKNKQIKAAITFNSKVYSLAKYFEALAQKEVQLIGYDALEQNVNYLKQGLISYLIAQRPEKQSYLTVRDMCNELIFKQEVKKVNYVPIDVLMKENIEYYMDFTV